MENEKVKLAPIVGLRQLLNRSNAGILNTAFVKNSKYKDYFK